MTEHWTEQYILARPLDVDNWLVVFPLTFGRWRVAVADGPLGLTGEFA